MQRGIGKSIDLPEGLSPFARVAGGLVLALLFCALLLGAASIPFVYEKGSILYKFGADKVFLRAGKVVGISAAVLLLLQLVLSGRIKVLDRIFALNRLYRFHRINAVVLSVLALLHPLLVFAPEDLRSFPLQLQYWPEMLGAVLLILIALLSATALWRIFLEFNFQRWLVFHRGAAFIAVVMLIFHILYGSEVFETGTPRMIVLLTAGAYMSLFLRVKLKPLFARMQPFAVSKVMMAGKDAVMVEVVASGRKTFQYAPGQFVFITFKSGALSGEEHPFTISSSPTRPENLQFTIRCSGDWTSMLTLLRPGEKAYIDGPYGRFSYRLMQGYEEYIMIAGGIGITPMLSMIRHMADCRANVKITLLWSNRTLQDVVYAAELIELERRLSGLRIIHIITRGPDGTSTGDRLNRERLQSGLSGCSREVPAFICGPDRMMQEVRQSLVSMGYHRGRIFTERFGL